MDRFYDEHAFDEFKKREDIQKATMQMESLIKGRVETIAKGDRRHSRG